ncbi:MAG: peptidylprolyl isomerase [Pseudomonadales bacterium]|nr:peptidylprolyl isomerase [Pseudomonadales bacterium]MCP5356937.1 peptidylprolyl isomerase [Pseudomonadales bacterium]
MNKARLLKAGALTLLTLLSSHLHAQRQVLDKVVAIVDEDVVLQSELDSRLEEVRANAAAAGQPLPPANELRNQIIETLIVENLQLQLAGRMGIRYDDDTINNVMQSIAEQNNMSFDEYVSSLEAAGRYLSTREQIRKELTLRDLQRGMVNRRINITDQEIDNFLNSEMGRVSMAPDYLVDQTLIPVGENDPAELIAAKQQFAEQMLQAVNNGTAFDAARLAAQRGAAANPPTAFQVSGGELGWRKADGLPSLFVNLVPEMKAGEVRGPIRSPSGFHLVKLVNVRGAINNLVKQTHARHILITPNEIRTEEQARTLIQNLHDRIENGEDFAAVARQNSDDAASVVAGGDMGWANEGGMPPDFEEVVNGLEVGKLSEPFRSTYGWHIAEVLERREQDLSRQFSRQQAENTLRSRKFDVELQNWLIEIREQAYVKISPPSVAGNP